MEAMVKLANDLSRWKRDNPNKSDGEDWHDNRHTYCHIMYYIDEQAAGKHHKPGWHKVEVRGFNITYNYELIECSAVSWTLAAGTCTLRITPENVHLVKILEDEPTLQVLYG